MAADLDKFVLEYKVELKDSIQRLESLQKKLEGVGQKSENTGNLLKSSFSKASPEFEKASMLLGRLGTVGLAAAAAFTAISAAVKLASKAMEEYNARAEVAYKVGIGTLGIEQFERNMRAASGGRVGRKDARAALGTVSDLVMSAYTDPTRTGEANRKLQRLGVSPVGAGGGIASTDEVMAQLSQKFAESSREQAIALGQLIGLTPQATEALRNLTAETMKSAQMTDDEAMRKANAAEASKKLQGAYNQVSESFNNIFNTIGEELLPAVAWSVDLFSKFVKALDYVNTAIFDFSDHTARAVVSLVSHWKEILTGKLSISDIINTVKSESRAPPAARTTAKDTEQYRAIRENLAQETLNVNTFSSAVSTFAGAVNKQQAWAAWAGAVGRAAGLPGSTSGGLGPDEIRGGATYNAEAARAAFGGGTGAPASTSAASGAAGGRVSRGIRNNNPGNIEYGAFAKSMGATGSDGRFAIFPTMQQGIAAMHALLQGGKYLGGGKNTISAILNTYAPANENDTKRYIATVSKATGIAPDAVLSAAQIPAVASAMMVHESGYRGGSAAGALPTTIADARNARATPTFGFSGPRIPMGGGESADTVQLNLLQQRIASRLHVPLDQLQQGRVTGADIGWAGSQEYTSLVNSRDNLVRQLSNPAIPGYSKEMVGNELRDVNLQLANMVNFMPELMANAKAGERQYSIGDVRINVNAGAISDPDKLAKAIRKELQMSLTQLVNAHASGDKG